jgi:hypothetical protein
LRSLKREEKALLLSIVVWLVIRGTGMAEAATNMLLAEKKIIRACETKARNKNKKIKK